MPRSRSISTSRQVVIALPKAKFRRTQKTRIYPPFAVGLSRLENYCFTTPNLNILRPVK